MLLVIKKRLNKNLAFVNIDFTLRKFSLPLQNI